MRQHPRGHRKRSRRRAPGETTSFSLTDVAISTILCLSFILVVAIAYRQVSPSPNLRSEDIAGGKSAASTPVSETQKFVCARPRVIDGDTIACGEDRIRLASIDAPELPGHCRPGRICVEGDPFASSQHLADLIEARELSCIETDIDVYGRRVAHCEAAGVDLSCAQVAAGVAVVRYGQLRCS